MADDDDEDGDGDSSSDSAALAAICCTMRKALLSSRRQCYDTQMLQHDSRLHEPAYQHNSTAFRTSPPDLPATFLLHSVSASASIMRLHPRAASLASRMSRSCCHEYEP